MKIVVLPAASKLIADWLVSTIAGMALPSMKNVMQLMIQQNIPDASELIEDWLIAIENSYKLRNSYKFDSKNV